MKKYARTGIAILLTALLFSLYIQILNYFAAPIWIPLLALTALFALLTAACIFLPHIPQAAVGRSTDIGQYNPSSPWRDIA